MIKSSNIDQFDLRYLSWRLDNLDIDLSKDVKRNGVLVPLVCVEFNGEHYIIDGFKRYHSALFCGIRSLPYVLINHEVSMAELVFSIQNQRIMLSTIHKLRFIQTFEWKLDSNYLSRLCLPYYEHLKKDISRCLTLSNSAQYFLHHKGFSLKEILNLLHYLPEYFDILLADDEYFNFSKRAFDEALSMGSALVKRHGLNIEDILKKSNYEDLKGSTLTPSQRLNQWLANLKLLSNPVLMNATKKIDDAISLVRLPAKISYDQTLENPGISIQSTISSVKELDELSLAISNPSVKHQLMDVVDLI